MRGKWGILRFLVLALVILFVILGVSYACDNVWKSYVHHTKMVTLSNLPGFVAHGSIKVPGDYYIFYGYAGLSGTELPPREIRRAGPFKIELAKGYAIKFSGSFSCPSVTVEDVTSSVSLSGEGAEVYVKNEMFRDGFLGIMLTKNVMP